MKKGFTPHLYNESKKNKTNLIPRKGGGFTLIELLVVIAIIGILSGIVLASLGMVREKARIVVAKAELKSIYNAFVLLESDSEEWPGHKTIYEIEGGASGNELCQDGCAYGLSDCYAGLLCDDPDDPYLNWSGPYLPELADPWGNEYFLDTDYDYNQHMGLPGAKWVVVIGSYGPNGQGLNDYDSDDIIYIISE